MPTITNDYSFIGGAIEGQLATAVNCTRRSALNETGLVLPYGRALVYDTSTTGFYNLPSVTGQKFMGVIERTVIYENETDSQGFFGFPVDVEFDFDSTGDIYVFTETDVTPNDPVFFRHTANGAGKDVIGRFRNDADAGTCDQVLVGASWQGSFLAGDFAILTLNLG